MKTVPVEGKLKGEVVSTIDIEQFEDIEEAVQTLGEEEVLGLVNRQYKADKANAERGKFRPSAASKKKLRQLAFEMCGKDEALGAELDKNMGSLEDMTAFLDSLSDRVKEEYGIS